MDTTLKRILAFGIDMAIVTLISTILINFTPIDPYKDKYDEAYQEYMDLTEEIQDDEELYKQNEDKIIDLNYELSKNQVVSNGVSIILLLLYFGVLQYICKGQTLGKKAMNIQVISNKEDKDLNIGHYLLRTIILTNVLFTILGIISVYLFKGKTFYYVTGVISILSSFVYMINVFMIYLRKDNRGLHDIIANTKVIDLKATLPVKDLPKEIEEKKTINVKEKPKKEKTTKKKA